MRNGDDYVVSGTKLWTTHAHFANWMFLLVRTQAEGKPQAGISFLLTPMDAPGLSVRPIISISGEHEVNQVFFDDVRVPVENLVGEENQGWSVAKYLLEFERGAGAQSARLKTMLDAALSIARQQGGDDTAFRKRWTGIDIELQALDQAERQVAAVLTAGKSVGDTIASRLKLTASGLLQQITELAMDGLGPYAAADQRAALGMGANQPPVGPEYALTPTAKYLNSRAATIYGGSNEVQHNILARVLLGA